MSLQNTDTKANLHVVELGHAVLQNLFESQ